MLRKLSLAALAALAAIALGARRRLLRRPPRPRGMAVGITAGTAVGGGPALFLRRLLWLAVLGPDPTGSAAALGLLIGFCVT
jgi:hypothetical protein